jgi:virginiamycin B lyase
VASVRLPGEPCAGLAVGFGYLWVPLCGTKPALAKVDLTKNRLSEVFPVGPAGPEGGIATGAGEIWLIMDSQGTMARITPDGRRGADTHVPAGSYNPIFARGRIWVTRAEGSEITALDAASGAIVASFKTGPNPRFLTAAGGAIWTLNQGDGTLTRIDIRSKRIKSIALETPGHGGDIGSGGGVLWTTMPKMPLSAVSLHDSTLLCQWAGPGGDSLSVAHGAIWLTDYHAGTISRIALADAIAHCKSGESTAH